MVPEVLSETESKMMKTIDAIRRDYMAIRTSRASPALVERLIVDYYGTATPLQQLATISTPEARLLVIQPWDKGSFSAIEKAILKSDLGINPTNDGKVIRLSLPHMTEDRRKDLVKLSRKKVEDGKISVRNIRRDANKDLDELETEKMITSDDVRVGNEQLQRLTDRFILEVERLGQSKEAEIMEV